jgi:hypothetical protein
MAAASSYENIWLHPFHSRLLMLKDKFIWSAYPLDFMSTTFWSPLQINHYPYLSRISDSIKRVMKETFSSAGRLYPCRGMNTDRKGNNCPKEIKITAGCMIPLLQRFHKKI